MPDSPNLLFTNAGMNQFVPIFLGQTSALTMPRSARRRHPEVHPRRRQAQRPRRRRAGHLPPHVLRDARQLVLRRLLQEGGDRLGVGTGRRTSGSSRRTRSTRRFTNPDKRRRPERVRRGSVRSLGREVSRAPGSIPTSTSSTATRRTILDDGRDRPVRPVHRDSTSTSRPPATRTGALVNEGDAPSASRSGTSSSSSSTRTRTAPSRRCPPSTSIPAWASSASPRIIQGTKDFTDFANAKISNYETDIFRPIFDEIEKLSGKKYGSHARRSAGSTGDDRAGEDRRRLPRHRRPHPHPQLRHRRRHPARQHRPQLRPAPHPAPRRALRPHAGFSRTVLLQAGGRARPNNGRCLSRRSARSRQIVQDVSGARKRRLTSTLDKGIALFEAEIACRRVARGSRSRAPRNPCRHAYFGAFAFRLYDEQGFPLDLTELMARERGLTVDTDGFEKLMEEQRERARKAQKKSVIDCRGSAPAPTHFLGYEHAHTGADVEAVFDVERRRRLSSLNNSALYAEMGGQVGDTGRDDRRRRLLARREHAENRQHLASFHRGREARRPSASTSRCDSIARAGRQSSATTR